MSRQPGTTGRTARDVRRAWPPARVQGRAWGLAMALALFVAGVAAGCGVRPAANAPRHLPPPVTEDGMTLYWGEDVKQAALNLIRHSQRYCYLDMYELADEDVITALSDARRRGVDVRVVVDATEHASQQEGVPALRRAGVPVESLRIPRGISHIKMLAVDGGVLIGGMNFGTQSWQNNDASVYIRRANPSFVALFRWDWARASGVPAAAPAYQHPLLDDRRTRDEVIAAIRRARRTVYMEAFVLSDRGVLDALSDAAQRGVVVEVLLDPSQSINRKGASALRDSGATVRFYQPYGDELMHAKILDVDEGHVFFIGSANFSHQAYTYNHEGDVELYDVPAFDRSLLDNLSAQISRGTDWPVQGSRWFGREE
ncbi:MAG: phosphatidylserine/phosphatidylglycerophosphate/cardiolipin synthase family protein [Alicyclobacillaceae bacterium]|nr:phosphatidylserine/phosphatidylglycerophosphate/cardiolipin synthase family protein [Alicyclobacillaceae bacterium]